MSFTPELAKIAKYEAVHRCQNPGCNKCFFDTGKMNIGDGLIVTNGSWNLQVAHTAPRDYKTEYDYNLYNPDNSRRYIVLDTLHHAEQEIRTTNLKNALTLLTGSTIRTFNYIKRNGWEDDDVPIETGHKLGLGRLELIDFNNQRRDLIKQLLFQKFGDIVYGIDHEQLRSRLGGGGRRRV